MSNSYKSTGTSPDSVHKTSCTNTGPSMSTTSTNGWIAQSDRSSVEMNAKFDWQGYYNTATLLETSATLAKSRAGTSSTINPFSEEERKRAIKREKANTK